MSIRLLQYALDNGPDNTTDCLILIALCDRADDLSGECFPGRADIARRARCSVRTVSRRRKVLQAEGWLAIQRRPNAVSVYSVNVAKLTALEQRRLAQQKPKGQSGTTGVTEWHNRDLEVPRCHAGKDTRVSREPSLNTDYRPDRQPAKLVARSAGLRNRWENAVALQREGKSWVHPVFQIAMTPAEPVPSFSELTEMAIERGTRDGHIAETVRKIRAGNGCPQ